MSGFRNRIKSGGAGSANALRMAWLFPNEKSPKENERAPSVPATQKVKTPIWSESLSTGTIAFEISPNESGALEARLLAMHDDSIPIEGDANMVAVDKIWWSDPVDGLEPGLWLTKTEDSRNLRIPMDSLAKYRVVVRNTTDKEIEFLVRLLPYDGQDVPYLIPSDKLDAKGKIVAPQPAKEFQAQGTANVSDGEYAASIITLAAGESALVPGEFGLFVGKASDERYPQIANFVPGTHWIVQPLLVHPLADKERTELTRLLGEFQVTKIDRSGKTRQEPVVRVGAPDDSKGKIAYAKYHLEVGTLDASANRNAQAAIWGEVEKGMQCGIRILNPQPSYKIGDTLEAEVLWRNTSDAVITTSRPRQLDLYPIIEAAEGQQPQIDFGARYELLPLNHDFQPGEVRSLGVTKITLVTQGTPGPKDNKEPGHITLEPGKYKLSASGGVGNISPWSGKYEFTVVDSKPVPPAPDTADSSSASQDSKVAPTLIRGSNYVVIPCQTTELQHELGNSDDDVNAPRVYVRVDGTTLEDSDGQLKPKSIDWDRLRLDMKPYANSRRGIVNFHIVNPELSDEARRQLEWTLKGFGEQHGGFAKAYWTMTFRGNSTKFWEEIDSVQKESERRGGGAESGTGNEIAKAYPVRTFLSCLTHRSADCVVLVAPRLTADTGDTLPDDIRNGIIQAVKQLTLPQKESIQFHIHREPAARKTVEWFTREGAKQLARDLGFENGAVSSAEYSPKAAQNSSKD